MPTHTLKATLKLESSNLFQTALSLTSIATETVNADGDMQTIQIPTGQTVEILNITENTFADIVYCYVSAKSTNTSALPITYTDYNSSTAQLASLLPGDFLWLPINARQGSFSMSAQNNDLYNTAKVDVLFAHRQH